MLRELEDTSKQNRVRQKQAETETAQGSEAAAQAEGLDRDPSKRNIVRQDAESGSAGCVDLEY